MENNFTLSLDGRPQRGWSRAFAKANIVHCCFVVRPPRPLREANRNYVVLTWPFPVFRERNRPLTTLQETEMRPCEHGSFRPCTRRGAI